MCIPEYDLYVSSAFISSMKLFSIDGFVFYQVLFLCFYCLQYLSFLPFHVKCYFISLYFLSIFSCLSLTGRPEGLSLPVFLLCRDPPLSVDGQTCIVLLTAFSESPMGVFFSIQSVCPLNSLFANF